MTEIWFEEELLPDLDEFEETIKGIKSPQERDKLRRIRSVIRLHVPRHKILDPRSVQKMAVADPVCKYVLIRLGIEFDPGIEARAANTGYVCATFNVNIYGEKNNPRVYSLAPLQVNSGKPETVKLKIEPDLRIAGTGGSLGGFEGDITVGQVAPVVRGFSGFEERQPYWNLEHHPEALLYGLRHFWMILETPSNMDEFHLYCRAEAYLQTLSGRLGMKPAERDTSRRPYHTINL